MLWTASAYIGCFFRASATIWGVERRPVWRAWPLRVALTMVFLILLALALLIIVLTGQLASSVGDALGIGEGVLDLYGFLKWPALLVVVVLLVALLYRTSPSGERSATHWRVLTPGGAVAVAAWVVVSVGFEVYVNAFATYDTTYGALGTTIAALVWLWLTNLTLLMGVELDAAIEFRKELDGLARRLRPERLHPLPARGRQLAEDHLQRAGDRHGEDRPDHAHQGAADHHDRDRRKARQLDRLPVDDGLDHVVLDLLVDQDHHRQDRGGHRRPRRRA